LKSGRARQAWWEAVERTLAALRRGKPGFARPTAADLAAVHRKLHEAVAAGHVGARRRQDHGRAAGRASSPARPPGYLAHPLQVLELGWPCRVDEVKAAFRARAKQTHPDCGGTAAAFRTVREAYELLLNSLSGR
jgi:hypothetical protein